MKLSNYYHVPWVRTLRSWTRSLGIIGFLKRCAGANLGFNEDIFEKAIKDSVRCDDTVWDIGAHVGLYTTQFLKWTEPNGKVVAFEPLPAAFGALKDGTDKMSLAAGRCVPLQFALTDRDGEVSFTLDLNGQEAVSTVSHISDAPTPGAVETKVQAFRADSVVSKLGLPRPQVSKIDVEGYEEEVLAGGKETFSHPDHRALFIEVHFNRLDARKKGEAPARIVKLLQDWGYRVDWLDASHLRGRRLPPN